MKVDFPVRTGPTTPMYISPYVLALISLYTLKFSIELPPSVLVQYMLKGSHVDMRNLIPSCQYGSVCVQKEQALDTDVKHMP